MNNYLNGTKLYDDDNLIKKKHRILIVTITTLSALIVCSLSIYLYFLNTRIEQLNIKNSKLEIRVSDYKEKLDEYYLKFKDLTEIVESKTN